MDRIKICRALARRLKARTYVEIGVSKGHAFLSMDCARKIAVDPFNQMKLWRFLLKDRSLTLCGLWIADTWRRLTRRQWHRFFELPSDDFFARVPHIFSEHKIDLAFIDGLHTYDQALRDVLNCAKYLNPGGVIVMHDCNPTTEAMHTPAASFEDARKINGPKWDGMWTGDVWKAVVEIRSLHPELDAFVLDCDYGVGIVVKRPAGKTLGISRSAIEQLGFKDLDRDRGRLIGLRPAESFNEFLASCRPIGA